MVAATSERIWTARDLAAQEDDDRRYEIIDGELIMAASPILRHQKISGRVYNLAHPFVSTHGLGEVYYAPIDVVISEHDVVQPDLMFVRQDRLHLFPSDDVIREPPDLVVEIHSPSTRRRDLIQKAKLYAWFGVPEYWQLYSDAPSFRLLALRGRQYEEVPPVAGQFHSIVIPGLVIDPIPLFAHLD